MLAVLLVVLAVFLLLCAVAHRLPVFHRLPVVGAAPPPSVSFQIEGGRGTSVQMGSTGPEDVIVRVTVVNDHHAEIPRATYEAFVVDAAGIERCYPDGVPYPRDGGMCLHQPHGEAASGVVEFWTASTVIPHGALLLFFRVTIPAPGDYRAVLRLRSPEFYGRQDHVSFGMLHALRSTRPHDRHEADKPTSSSLSPPPPDKVQPLPATVFIPEKRGGD